jgi:hypothetical protein
MKFPKILKEKSQRLSSRTVMRKPSGVSLEAITKLKGSYETENLEIHEDASGKVSIKLLNTVDIESPTELAILYENAV